MAVRCIMNRVFEQTLHVYHVEKIRKCRENVEKKASMYVLYMRVTDCFSDCYNEKCRDVENFCKTKKHIKHIL